MPSLSVLKLAVNSSVFTCLGIARLVSSPLLPYPARSESQWRDRARGRSGNQWVGDGRAWRPCPRHCRQNRSCRTDELIIDEAEDHRLLCFLLPASLLQPSSSRSPAGERTRTRTRTRSVCRPSFIPSRLQKRRRLLDWFGRHRLRAMSV